ncbi:putative arylformamidase [Dufourea novaeangliae]|uniref:Putative arylformamidase n=1 Tax=Dufourea novaeangliae TaxID=178035 RepID=A0A154NY38_DUFNO|nr:putative arylformamidase [Dufourea novaeangliae]
MGKFVPVTEKARKVVKHKLDVPYGSTDRTKYDVYGTNLPKDAPIFIYIHGGYWQEGSRDVATFAVPVLVGKGIRVITIGYDLCPQVRLGDIISEIKMAVEEILKLASDNGSRCVWVAGHSAGAHLAMSLLFDEPWLNKMMTREYMNLLKGLVLIGGIYNLNPLLGTTINDALKLTKDEIKAYSFIDLDTTKRKPIQGLKVIVTDGECDTPEFINESRKCAQKLVTIVDDVQYLLLRENVDHFDIVEKLTEPEFLLTKTILAHMSSN